MMNKSMLRWLETFIVIAIVDLLVSALEWLTGQPRLAWLFLLLIIFLLARAWLSEHIGVFLFKIVSKR